MSPTTDCPACGAKVTYTGSEDTITCDFCGTQLHVVDENGGSRVELLSSPRPQSDVLTERGEEAAAETFSEALDDATSRVASRQPGGPTPEDTTAAGPVDIMPPGGSQDLEDFSGIRREVGVPPDEPVAPGYTTQGSMAADADNLFRGGASPTPPPGAATIPETMPYQEGRVEGGAAVYETPSAPSGTGNRNRWIGIAIGVVVVACVLCACSVGALMLFAPGFEFQLF